MTGRDSRLEKLKLQLWRPGCSFNAPPRRDLVYPFGSWWEKPTARCSLPSWNTFICVLYVNTCVPRTLLLTTIINDYSNSDFARGHQSTLIMAQRLRHLLSHEGKVQICWEIRDCIWKVISPYSLLNINRIHIISLVHWRAQGVSYEGGGHFFNAKSFSSPVLSNRYIYRTFDQFYSLPGAYWCAMFRRVITIVPLGTSPSVDQRRSW